MGFLKDLTGSGVIGGLIDGVGSLIGANQSKKNAEKQALMNYLAQKEFAQNGIRWRVDDAKKSGIHPLFAIGANTSGFAPVSGYSGDGGISDFSSSMGQSIDRAVQAKKTPAEREIENLQQQKMFDLDVQQKEANIALTNAEISRIANLSQQQVPPMPKAFGRSGMIIDGQAQSYPTAGTTNKPAEVISSFAGGYQQAGHNPDVAYDLANGGYTMRMSDSQKDANEDDAIGTVQWNFRNRLFNPPSPPYKAKAGYKWFYNPVTGIWSQIKIDFSYLKKSRFFKNGFRN